MIKRILLITVVLVAACNTSSDSNSKTGRFDGVWLSIGYGQILEVSGGNYEWYDYTTISLISDYTGTLSGNRMTDDDNIFEGTLSLDGANLVWSFSDGNMKVFETIAALPPETPDTNDPEVNFDIFWQTYEETSILFPLTGVDWQATYDQYRPQVDQNTTDVELFTIFENMIDPLNDGHSTIEDEAGDQYFEGGPDIQDLWDLEEPEGQQALGVIQQNYIDGNLDYTANDTIASGTVYGSVAYINLLEFEDVSNNSDDELAEHAAFTQAIDTLLTGFQDADALIVDLRFNLGGLDWLGLAFANRLTDQQRLVWSKQVRTGGYTELSDPIEFYIAPEGVQWLNRPIVVLTSGNTLSAAETQVLALKVLPNVTLIGEQTYGIYSDMLAKILPNDWFFDLSNEQYLSAEGINYEQIGIEPDIVVTGAEAGFNQGEDFILERALQYLGVP